MSSSSIMGEAELLWQVRQEGWRAFCRRVWAIAEAVECPVVMIANEVEKEKLLLFLKLPQPETLMPREWQLAM